MLEQKQLEDLKERVTAAVGLPNLQALSKTQAKMCEMMLTERLEKVDFQIDQIKDAEFVGIYEMVIAFCNTPISHLAKARGLQSVQHHHGDDERVSDQDTAWPRASAGLRSSVQCTALPAHMTGS